jgi:hypothetical protein
MKKILLTILLVSCSTAFADGYDYIYRGTRTLGMGGAFTAVSDDVNALFYNPAGLNRIKPGEGTITALNPRVEANTSAISIVSKLKGSTKDILTNLSPYVGKNMHFGVSAGGIPSLARHNFAMALLLPEFKNNTTLRRTVAVQAIEDIVVDSGLMVGYSHGFLNDRLSVGADLKFLVRGAGSVTLNAVDLYTKKALNFKDIGGYGFGIDGDIGGMYTFNKVLFFVPTVGLTINNIGATKFPTRFDSSNSVGNLPEKFRLRRSVGLGSKFELPSYSLIKKWIFALDINQIGLEGSMFKKMHLGTEALFFDFLWLRGGINQGYFTFGLGLNLRIFKLDFYTYGEELGDSAGTKGDRRIGLQLAFAW